jgi:hypothetical protein
MQKLFTIILLFAAALSCSDSNDVGSDNYFDVPDDGDNVVNICIVERSCMTDKFAERDPSKDQIVTLVDYFHSLGLKIFSAEIDPFFFDAVCEACHICPSGRVFRVSTTAGAEKELIIDDAWLIDCAGEKEFATVSFHETQCANPYANFINGSDLIDKRRGIISYLSNNGLDVYRMEILDAEPEACLACHCKSDQLIRLLIDREQLELASELGFN